MTALLEDYDPTPLIHTIANSVIRRYSMVERDDLAQELWAWYLGSPGVVCKYLQEPEVKDLERKLGRRLKDVAEAHCRKAKARIEGYQTDDECFYDPGLLRNLLPLAWADDPIQLFKDSIDDGSIGHRPWSPENSNNLLTMVADIKIGLGSISPEYRHLLGRVFRDGLDYKRLARELEITGRDPEHAAEQRVQRALVALSTALGGERPDYNQGPGSRRAITNAHAQALLGWQE